MQRNLLAVPGYSLSPNSCKQDPVYMLVVPCGVEESVHLVSQSELRCEVVAE